MPVRLLGLSTGGSSAADDAGGLGYVSFEEDGIDFGSKDLDRIRVHEILRDFGLASWFPRRMTRGILASSNRRVWVAKKLAVFTDFSSWSQRSLASSVVSTLS